MKSQGSHISSGELARMITALENGSASLESLREKLGDPGVKPLVIGITGPPGVGKSTLLNQLIARFREQGDRVGVMAVDPSSIVTGGALLGDRIRMQKNTLDSGVFIRSMATRGHLGGLTGKTAEVIELYRMAGFDPVIVETVGVGQTEVEIFRVADMVVAVTSPAHGDEIQVMKAGIFEIAHAIVLNKSDYKGADNVQRDLERIAVGMKRGRWDVPVIRSVASEQQGIDEIFGTMTRFREFMRGEDETEA